MGMPIETTSVTITVQGEGFVGDPTNFSGFNEFYGIEGKNDTINWNSQHILVSGNGTAEQVFNLGGIVLTFYNFNYVPPPPPPVVIESSGPGDIPPILEHEAPQDVNQADNNDGNINQLLCQVLGGANCIPLIKIKTPRIVPNCAGLSAG